MNRSGEIGLKRYLLTHEEDIAKAGKNDTTNEWSLLYLCFWQIFGHKPGEKA